MYPTYDIEFKEQPSLSTYIKKTLPNSAEKSENDSGKIEHSLCCSLYCQRKIT